MTIFIVSLALFADRASFLPHTIDFALPEGYQRKASHHHRRKSSGQRATLFGRLPGSQTATPTSASASTSASTSTATTATTSAAASNHASGSTVAGRRPSSLRDQGRIFSCPDYSSSGIEVTSQQPRLLAPSDPHSPRWGSPGAFNQPKAQALAPPSSSILNHALGQESASELSRTEPTVLPPSPVRPSIEPGSQPNQESVFESAEWTVQPSEQGNGGLLNAIRSAVDWPYMKDKLWVGTLGMPTDALHEKQKEAIAEKLAADYEALTIFVSDNDFDSHYLHFCKMILWPVFHYQIPDNPKSKAYEDHSWIFYRRVNYNFAKELIKNWKRGDVIWVHDYHLLLVPAMVRKEIPDAQIGIFLHVAFPSSEVFRCLSVRVELLKGMLGANLIGFQTQEYCHHFLQTCSRLLNVEATKDGVQLEDRFVNVGTFPIGIDPVSLDIRRQCGEVKSWINILQEKFKGKRLIVARDKLDNVRGVRQKLLAYELFLNKYPHWRDSVVLIQVASTTTEQPELEASVSDIATRINSVHSNLAHQPLIFHKQDLLFDQYLALISVADVFMVTSLREGMNLTSHEFIHCQDGLLSSSKHGPLILSEFTGSASIFNYHPLLVNPWNYQECADAINTALEMSPETRLAQWTRLNTTAKDHVTTRWVNNFTEALDRAYRQHSTRETVAVPRLSIPNLCNAYRTSSRRLLILDYEGTLVSWGQPTSTVLTTPQRAIDTLTDLLEDPLNTVYVMSSRMPEDMERLFSRVPGLGLIAENGCFVRPPPMLSPTPSPPTTGTFVTSNWIRLIDMTKMNDWKLSLSPMLRYFQERTEGSWIEETHASLIFHYERAEDSQSAERHASECANNVNDSCGNHSLRAIQMDGCVVAGPVEPNKGTAANVVFSTYTRRESRRSSSAGSASSAKQGMAIEWKSETEDNDEDVPDFILVIGDGRDDEPAFRWANELGEEKKVKNVMTVTLGFKNTEAMATLNQGVTGKLVDISQRRDSASLAQKLSYIPASNGE
ncbi:alpha,alpha-trehalose phosphate synthase subunit, putative [Trichophyton benhamiae CBS 112371]|uniref:Alpha,alpha-trehalose phosphate synthase subunit, putative n=1 Tax=Arthroderma benhamiae (strain ATCC MYA-4681 / CBS 112371) TaxID=663331 RepID=D4AXJ6_ARTBC|nr:alpha,alpha-trehalose phosphate synthase subunit, putative [Trichophyton benhamiae CBS 112371]EFE32024.1 alpha,alpha-trehalose phosphate synthase subunit, putative [Trichophyton benhamiae CBS 112371]